MKSTIILCLIIFLLLLVAPIASAQNHIAAFKFITDPQSLNPGAVSAPITLQAQDGQGNPVKVEQTLCLGLFSSSSGGEFSSNQDNWQTVSVLTVNSNWTSRTFYYKDVSSGSYSLTAKVAAKPFDTTCSGWPQSEWSVQWTASQSISVGQAVQQNQGGSPDLPSVGQAPAPAVPQPQIRVYAGEDREVAVGSLATFLGQATGLEGKPLENARFWWNFGDGGAKEGRSVAHTYQFPGKYSVGLHVSSGGYGASDYFAVIVVPNRLVISSVLSGEDGFVRLRNDSDTDIDIDGWSLEDSGGIVFRIPPRMRIEKKAEVTLANAVTGLLKSNFPTSVIMRYPDGKEAYRLTGQEVLAPSAVSERPQAFKTAIIPIIQEEIMASSSVREPSPDVASVSSASVSGKVFLGLAALLSMIAAVAFLVVKKRWKNQG
ncbi:MAG: lamin tail domain-containing protein [Candidatus Sungbacteria bacterium]|nr:lamin tail domain-containing protein [Candidatus Sungbacteria bacterium]